MSFVSAIAGTVANHSKLVLVLMVLSTLVVGAGITELEQDSSLERFETETAESSALAYTEQNFSTTDVPNETTVQVIQTGDEALSQESLVASLRFQQTLYENESIRNSLVDGDPIIGLANVVATTELREDDISALEDRQESLEADAEELEAERDQLEERAAKLEADRADLEKKAEGVENGDVPLDEEADDLEERGAELEADAEALEHEADELNETGEHLGDSLNQTAEAQRDIEEAEVLHENGNIDDEEYEQTVSNAETEIKVIREDATTDLNETQTDRYVEVEGDVRDKIGEFAELRIERLDDEISEAEYETRYAELESETKSIAESGVEDVLAEEIAALEAEEDRLESERTELEDRRDELEPLDEERAELEDRRDELEDERDDLEAEAEELAARERALQTDVDALYGEGLPPLDEQIERLSSMDGDAFDEQLERVLVGETPGTDGQIQQMLPHDHERGAADADAHVTFVTQVTDEDADGGTTDEDIVETQLEMRERATDSDENYTVVGSGIIEDNVNQSIQDSLLIVGPLALLLVVGTLAVAYRDPLDIVLGVAGIVTVLVWTGGVMGWLGFSFNIVFVAIPVLLIGISIDYAIHVFMRYRERRVEGANASGTSDDDSVRGSMRIALGGVGAALVWVTATTVLGLLSNLISPIAPIEEFGFVSAVGIVCAFVVFLTFVPAAKIEVDELLERVGFDRRRRAFGAGGGRLERTLSIGSSVAVRAPLAMLMVVSLVTAAGVAGAADLDTSFEEEDFLSEDPPAWMDRLPDAIAPGENDGKADFELAEARFPHVDAEGQLLVEGNVSDEETLERIAAATAVANESESIDAGADGKARIQSPITEMKAVADRNRSFDETFSSSDTNDDGVPDENLSTVYDEFFAADESAAENVIYRADGADSVTAESNGSGAAANGTGTGEYEAIRMIASFDGGATASEIDDEMNEVAAAFEGDRRDPPWSVTVTGDDIVTHVMEQGLFETVLESMAITLGSVLVFLTVGYALTGRGVTLALVTLLPVALSVCWVLGTMSLLGIPFNVLTAMVTSLTIGMGIDYCIHVSDRFVQELSRKETVAGAIATTVTGTGGALLGSAATTVCGFGVLIFTLVPMLRQFGLVTALSITYAFLASVLVLPSLLVLWTRFGDADLDVPFRSEGAGSAAATDGGNQGGRTRGQRHRRQSGRRRR